MTENSYDVIVSAGAAINADLVADDAHRAVVRRRETAASPALAS